MANSDIQCTIETVWRIEAARLIAALARLVNDVGLAEDLAQDALVIALEQWPAAGIPRNPGAWLMTAARRRAWCAMRVNAPCRWNGRGWWKGNRRSSVSA